MSLRDCLFVKLVSDKSDPARVTQGWESGGFGKQFRPSEWIIQSEVAFHDSSSSGLVISALTGSLLGISLHRASQYIFILASLSCHIQGSGDRGVYMLVRKHRYRLRYTNNTKIDLK